MSTVKTPCIIIISVVFLLLCGVGPCFSVENGLERIERAGVLRLAICAEDFPPFAFRSKGKWTGYDIDLAAALAKELGVGLEILTHPDWEGVIDMVRDGAADIGMSSLSSSPERTRKVAFSNSYISLHQGILANQLTLARLPGAHPAAKLNSSGTVIAVRTGSIYRQLLPGYLPLAEIKEYSSWDACYTAVREGAATGVIGDEAQLLIWLGRNKGDSMRLVPVLFEDKQDPISIAVAKQNKELLRYINAFLLHQPQNINIQRIFWEYKGSGDNDAGVVEASREIPASEYPALFTAIILAAFMAAYLMFLAGGRNKLPPRARI